MLPEENGSNVNGHCESNKIKIIMFDPKMKNYLQKHNDIWKIQIPSNILLGIFSVSVCSRLIFFSPIFWSEIIFFGLIPTFS